ncbi:unnamed protein product [Linum trigynum]|uniref:Myb/SANT-like domain-containing protein n=1 Tax=Linum trigynum TaxID=586398 RepID=A0AAV2CIA6_9ROSI
MAENEVADGEMNDVAQGRLREYNKWTKKHDVVFIECMLDLVQSRQVESGNLKNGGFKKLEAMMVKKIPGFNLNVRSRHRWFKNKYNAIYDVQNGSCSGFGWDESKKIIVADDDVFKNWVKSHSHFSGLNKTSFVYYDQLARVFGKDRAVGSQAGSAADMEAEVEARFRRGMSEDPIMLNDETSQRVLEEMINEGINHRELLEDPKPAGSKATNASVSNKRSKIDRSSTSSAVVASEIVKIYPLMEKANMNIERMANSFCHEDPLMIRRETLFEELSQLEGLSQDQVISAALILVKEDRIAQLYYQLPTDEEKLAFLFRLIN